MPKRIPCRVVQTKLSCPSGDWSGYDSVLRRDKFVVKPWDKACYFGPPAPTGPSLVHKPVGNVDKLFADFTRPAFLRGLAVGRAEGGQSLILDYYA